MKLFKRLIALALCAALTLGLAPAAHAAGSIRVTLPRFAVTLGGQTIDPAREEYPFLVYKGITYLPLTYYGCRLLGLYEKWTSEGGLVISDAGAKGQYESTPRRSSNSGALYARKAAGKITLCGESIDNRYEEYPFLLFRDITYLPMTWANMHERLGCAYSFDGKTGLVIDRAQSTDGAALYLPIYRDGDMTGAVAAWEGWFWFQDGEGWISRVPMAGGAREKLFELPANAYLSDNVRAMASLTVRDGKLYMTYHLGGATMGHDEQFRFNADGSYVLLTKSSGAVGEFDDMLLLANCQLMPTPDNLRVSRDGGETWEKFGAEDYIYGWAYHAEKDGAASGGRGTGDTIYRSGNGAWLLATFVPNWGKEEKDANGEYPERFSNVCRVDLTSGRTEAVTGPAQRFQIVDDVIWYIDFDGALHRCALDSSDERELLLPTARVSDFCVDGDTVYLVTQRLDSDQSARYLAVNRTGGTGEVVTYQTDALRAIQLDRGYLTALFEGGDGTGGGLAVFRNGEKIYELRGPDILAAGVSGGKLYYVLK